MVPSNPDNNQPLIYRIADALGVFHLVAPVNHTHSQSEVAGLADALAAKANASDVTSALNGKADANHTHHDIGRGAAGGITVDEDGEISVGCTSIVITMQGVQGDIEVLPENAANLKRALLTPDATPTANSTNLVTSGGVAAALAGKQDALTFDTTPTANSTNPVTSGGVKAAIDDATKAVFGSMPYYITAAHEKMYVHTRILRNNTGSTIKLTECIDVSALPAAERHVYWNSPDIDLPNNTEIGIRFVRASNAIFLYYDGNFDY